MEMIFLFLRRGFASLMVWKASRAARPPLRPCKWQVRIYPRPRFVLVQRGLRDEIKVPMPATGRISIIFSSNTT